MTVLIEVTQNIRSESQEKTKGLFNLLRGLSGELVGEQFEVQLKKSMGELLKDCEFGVILFGEAKYPGNYFRF